MRSAIFGFAGQLPVELRSLICAAGWRFCQLRCPYPDKMTVLQYYFRQPARTKHDNPVHNALLVRYIRWELTKTHPPGRTFFHTTWRHCNYTSPFVISLKLIRCNFINVIIPRQVVRNRHVAMVHFTAKLVMWKNHVSWKMNYNDTNSFHQGTVRIHLCT